MITKVLLLPLLTQPLLVFFLCNTWVQTMHLHKYQLLKSIILSYTKLPPEDSCRSQHVDLLGLYHSISLILSWCFLPSTSLLYQLHRQPQGSLRFSSATFSVFLVLRSLYLLFFLISFSAVMYYLSDGTVQSHQSVLQVEFTESGLFSALSFISIFWLILVSFVCNLDIMIFTNAPVEIGCSLVVPGDVLCFGLCLTSRYNMVHCLFMLWTHSAFTLHLLATYYFLVVSGVYCLVLSCCQ